MNLGLRDRRVLVSGSSRGIGRALAETFLCEGARVLISGRDRASLESARGELANLGSVLCHPGDMNDPAVAAQAVEMAVQHWGGLDHVVANVGSGTVRSGWQLDHDDWEEVFHENLFGGMALVHAAIPALQRAERGSITLIASIAGLEAIDAPVTYAAAKAGVLAATKSLSRMLGQEGVRVNAVAPGNVLFPGGSWERRLAERPELFQDYIKAEVPLQRFGSPREIADAAVFLASERASFITGACLVVDGGQTRAFG